MPSFSYITRAEVRAAVRQRLQDAGDNHFWVDDELNDLIDEALRVWNAAALYHRCRATFNVTAGTAFYDISDLLQDADSEFILQRTLTVQDLTKSIIYALMENAGGEVDGSTWVGTECFSLDDVQQSVYRRVNRFLEDTGQIITKSQVAIASGNGIVDIPTEWIDVRRAGWITPESAHNVLWRTSEYVADSQFDAWNITGGRPEAYSVAVTPLIRLQLLPPPDDIGTLDLLMVNALTTTGALNIFNDFGWVVKWGAIADLLGQDGEGRDAERALYAEQRYQEGVQLAKIMTTVLRAEINGRVVQSCALFDLDAGVPNWQDAIGDPTDNVATPNTPAFAGPNLVAFYPVPGATLDVPAGNHSISFDVVRNAFVPATDSAFVQISREYEISLITYICHLALFKSQGTEFQASFSGYKNLFNVAQGENARLRENSPDFPVLATQQDLDIPRKAAIPVAA